MASDPEARDVEGVAMIVVRMAIESLVHDVDQRLEDVGHEDETYAERRIGRPMALRQAPAERSGSRGATAGLGSAVGGPIVEAPRSFLSALKAGVFRSARAGLQTALLADLPRRNVVCRQRLWMSMSGGRC